ncbi:MAG: hypothetical protein AAGL49_05035 [Pseudomonadota bacterium]
MNPSAPATEAQKIAGPLALLSGAAGKADAGDGAFAGQLALATPPDDTAQATTPLSEVASEVEAARVLEAMGVSQAVASSPLQAEGVGALLTDGLGGNATSLSLSGEPGLGETSESLALGGLAPSLTESGTAPASPISTGGQRADGPAALTNAAALSNAASAALQAQGQAAPVAPGETAGAASAPNGGAEEVAPAQSNVGGQSGSQPTAVDGDVAGAQIAAAAQAASGRTQSAREVRAQADDTKTTSTGREKSEAKPARAGASFEFQPRADGAPTAQAAQETAAFTTPRTQQPLQTPAQPSPGDAAQLVSTSGQVDADGAALDVPPS